MDTTTSNLGSIVDLSRAMARNVMTMAETRIELLLVELQEERDRCFRALFFVMASAACGLLAVVALSTLLVVALWQYSPLLSLLFVALIHVVASLVFYSQYQKMRRDWDTLGATMDQIRKDQKCLSELLGGEERTGPSSGSGSNARFS